MTRATALRLLSSSCDALLSGQRSDCQFAALISPKIVSAGRRLGPNRQSIYTRFPD